MAGHTKIFDYPVTHMAGHTKVFDYSVTQTRLDIPRSLITQSHYMAGHTKIFDYVCAPPPLHQSHTWLDIYTKVFDYPVTQTRLDIPRSLIRPTSHTHMAGHTKVFDYPVRAHTAGHTKVFHWRRKRGPGAWSHKSCWVWNGVIWRNLNHQGSLLWVFLFLALHDLGPWHSANL